MKRIIKFITFFLALCLIIPTSVATVFAGNDGGYIEDGSIYNASELSITEWYFSSSNVSLDTSKKALVFNTSAVGKLFTSRTNIKKSSDVKDALKVNFTITLNSLNSGNTFGFVFGSPTLLSELTEKGTSFLYFSKSGSDITCGIKRFTAGGSVNLLTSYAITGSTAAVSFIITSSGKITLTINDAEVYSSSEENEVDAEGFCGFAHYGITSLTVNLSAEIMSLKILNEYYSRPTAPLIVRADFSNNEFNMQEWFLNSTASCPTGGLFVENGALRWNGAGQNAMFGTRYKYSNFEIQYDLFDAKNTPNIVLLIINFHIIYSI